LPSLAPHATSHLGVVHHFLVPYLRTGFHASATIGGQAPFAVTNIDAPFYRYFNVTTPADDGAGSLRQAIVDANANCFFAPDVKPYPCKIAFQIGEAVPASGWITIEPESPLPEIVATDVTVDGESQTAIADSNPQGPEVFLLGDRAGVIDGLRFRGIRVLLRGLAIGGFAQNGVLVQTGGDIRSNYLDSSGSGGAIRNNYLGVDPTGRLAVPNGLRGLMSRSGLEVIGNVISGNSRSGIFMVFGDGAVISGNRIGVAAASNDPLPNGASGIFVGGERNFVMEARISDNVIGNSGDFGIAMGSTTATVQRNTIFNSGHGGIDVGLDGPTSAGTPAITSVHYDATKDQTVIEGTASAPVPGFTTVYIYANHNVGTDGFAEGEQFLGSVKVTGYVSAFTFAAPGDLRDLYVDAYSILRVDYGDAAWDTTSEFCRPLHAE
jgi:hypothetical protein